jgi:uncharacterized protein
VYDELLDPVLIPYRSLPPDTLGRVVEAFVLREGTDYGSAEYSLADKVAHVLRQLERGEAQISFDPNTDTVDIQLAGLRRGREPPD